MSEFQRLYDAVDLCESSLEKTRWPDAFRLGRRLMGYGTPRSCLRSAH